MHDARCSDILLTWIEYDRVAIMPTPNGTLFSYPVLCSLKYVEYHDERRAGRILNLQEKKNKKK